MPNPDWYKKKLSELDSWHAAFSAQCAATGTTHGLSAGNVTQAATDATFVAALLNFDQQIRGVGPRLGVSQTATFVDTTAPLVAGQPEVREYRAQGMIGNNRVGALSATV